jgi:drug/metabolite transporter (DMT)-like permease
MAVPIAPAPKTVIRATVREDSPNRRALARVPVRARPARTGTMVGMSPRQALLLALAVVAVSFSAIFIRYADAPGISIALYRNALSAAVLLPWALSTRWAEIRRLTGRQWGIALLSGALLAAHFATWIPSVKLTTVAASVVLVASSPIFVAAGARAFFGERVGRGTLAGILVGLAGAAIVSGGDVHISARAAGGDLLALAGAAAAAGYFLAGGRLRQDVSLLAYVGLVYAICAVLLLPVALLSGDRLGGFDAKTWWMFALMAAVPQGIGHTTFNYLLKDVGATVVAISVMGEPVGSALLAVAFFGEIPPWTAVVGGVALLAGIYVAVTATARERRAVGRTGEVITPLE